MTQPLPSSKVAPETLDGDDVLGVFVEQEVEFSTAQEGFFSGPKLAPEVDKKVRSLLAYAPEVTLETWLCGRSSLACVWFVSDHVNLELNGSCHLPIMLSGVARPEQREDILQFSIRNTLDMR